MNVAVIGGGYAGMAAAVTLAERGMAATVFESAAHLGGRARRVSYHDATLDNGLHILIGAYRETLRLIALVNPDPQRALLRLPLEWIIQDRFRLRAASLPAPLHLLAGLLAARGAPFAERLRAVSFVRALRASGFRLPQDMSVASLLQEHRQGADLTRWLWQPLCVAALNTPPDVASAQVFLNVLRDSLSASRADSDILLARTDLTALFPGPAADYVLARRGRIFTGHTVTAIARTAGGYAVHAHGERFDFTHLICALPPHRLLPAITGLPELSAIAAMVERFHYQPINTIYLQYPERVALPSPMLGMTGGLTQWVFDREAICGQRGLVAAVISAAGPHQDLTQEELAPCVHAELKQHLGALPTPQWQRVIAEKRATFSCSVGLVRPAQRTALRNFHLAGDYTASDYPATLEAAVRSGITCAHHVLESA